MSLRVKPPPPGPSPDAASALARLESLIDGLLDPEGGCPWDRRQTTRSLTEDFLEEVYELRQALLEDSAAGVLEEAGDVAFLLVFLARMTKRTFSFDLANMLDAATDKMLARHPHVFGEVEIPDDMGEFLKLWHKLKRKAKPETGVLASVPVALPALTRCHRLSQKAGRAGFDFPDVASVRLQVDRELAELDAELAARDTGQDVPQERLVHEIGDVLCSVANLARLLGVSAEKALDACNRRFITRFEWMEAALRAKGLTPEGVDGQELESLWEAAKKDLAEKALAEKANAEPSVGDGSAAGRPSAGQGSDEGETAAGPPEGKVFAAGRPSEGQGPEECETASRPSAGDDR